MVTAIDADLVEVELHAPPHIEDRRAFICDLLAWVNVLQAEVDRRQSAMNHMDAMEPDA